jgi:hypothetical protein
MRRLKEVGMWHRAVVTITLLGCKLGLASASDVPPDLREAMQARLNAVWSKDATAWSRLTADEFTVVLPDGTLINKPSTGPTTPPSASVLTREAVRRASRAEAPESDRAKRFPS